MIVTVDGWTVVVEVCSSVTVEVGVWSAMAVPEIVMVSRFVLLSCSVSAWSVLKS